MEKLLLRNLRSLQKLGITRKEAKPQCHNNFSYLTLLQTVRHILALDLQLLRGRDP
jgi:hypothetical protein